MTMSPEFFSRTEHTARKEHKCVECSCVIRKGELYERISGKWEGDVGSYHTCMRCQPLQSWAIGESDEPLGIGELYSFLSDYGTELCADRPGLLFNIGRQVVKIRARARADGARRW